ncbi:MAG: hypothetical protein ACOC2K_02740 [Bacteroidota bacterium]
MKLAIITILIIFMALPLSAEENKTGFGGFVDNYLNRKRDYKNKVLLEFYFYPGKQSFPERNFRTDMSDIYTAEIVYGFKRINEIEDYPGIFSHAGEFTFLGNRSSHLVPGDLSPGITSDIWHFGFGTNSGYGYKINGDELLLDHSISFIWSHTDFENYSIVERDQKRMDLFDERFRFGMVYRGGLTYNLFSTVHLTAGYEHALIYQRHLFGKWFGTWLAENALQRWIDFFEDDFLDQYGNLWPVVKFAYKNAISILLYEIRRDDIYWPYNSAPALNFDGFKIGITLII